MDEKEFNTTPENNGNFSAASFENESTTAGNEGTDCSAPQGFPSQTEMNRGNDGTQWDSAPQNIPYPQNNFATQDNIPPQGSYNPQGNYPPQGNCPPQWNFNPQENYNPQGNYPPQGYYNLQGNYPSQGYYNPQENYPPQGNYNAPQYNPYGVNGYQPGVMVANPQSSKKKINPILYIVIAVVALGAIVFGAYRSLVYVSADTLVGSWGTQGDTQNVITFNADGTCNFGDLLEDNYDDFLGGLFSNLVSFRWTLDKSKNLTISMDFIIQQSMSFKVHRFGKKLTLETVNTETGEKGEIVLYKIS